MRKLLLFTLLFSLIAAQPGPGPFVFAVAIEENVTVYGEYLTDSDGYNYGAKYYLASTVNEQVCVHPYVAKRENVNGSVAGPFLLEANESGVAIGSFISADQSKPWAVDVQAKWKRGTC